MFFAAFSLVAVVARQLFVAINTYALPSSTGSCFYLFAPHPPHTHTFIQMQTGTHMLPSEIVVVGKTQFSFLQPYQKKEEEKRQQCQSAEGEREGKKKMKREANCVFFFLLAFFLFFLFGLACSFLSFFLLCSCHFSEFLCATRNPLGTHDNNSSDGNNNNNN